MNEQEIRAAAVQAASTLLATREVADADLLEEVETLSSALELYIRTGAFTG
jgi:uncharacterized protein YgiM (DUF1202 family)